VDIVQAVGRALRPAPNKKFGYVIVPILHDADATADDIFKSPAFKEILTTLRALAANDDRICNGNLSEKGSLPSDIPSAPQSVYVNKGWDGVGDSLSPPPRFKIPQAQILATERHASVLSLHKFQNHGGELTPPLCRGLSPRTQIPMGSRQTRSTLAL
jgi:hypothetical protein